MSTDSVATPIGTIGLRDEAESDADFLYGLFAARKLAEMQAMPLDEAGKEQLLRMQYRSMSYTYRTQFPNARFSVLVLNNEPVGRLIVDTDAERVYLVDIALMPQWHGRGTGQALLQELQRQASALGVPVTSQVMVNNAASLRMHEKAGFRIVGDSFPSYSLAWYPSGT